MIKEGYIKKEDRKKILLLSDDMMLHSGIATMSREIVFGTAHHYNWVQLGAAIEHPHKGQRIDISDKVNEKEGNKDSSVIIYPYNGYGDPMVLRQLLSIEKPDAIMIFTDPRYWVWIFNMEDEIRKICPIIYLNIWDSTPAPLWNKPYYESVDTLLAISKQTENINRIVLGEEAEKKIIKYVPHGINENDFYPIEDQELISKTKQIYFKGKEPKFVALFNSRNIKRKCVSDLILSWKLFFDKLKPEDRENTALLLHTERVDNNGTDLNAVIESVFGEDSNIYFTDKKLPTPEMNLLYNISDVTILPSSNEGWGLSLTESLMSGTMIIANVTGGMQDQMRFEDEEGNWIKFDENFLSNHFGKYKKCGVWAKPVFPNNMSLIGSPQTPYIFDDKLDFRDLAKTIGEVYLTKPEIIKQQGLKGREWVTSEESGMSASNMCKNIIEGFDETIEKFIPKKSFELIKIKDKKINKLPHPIIY